jgi:hypothetical protein
MEPKKANHQANVVRIENLRPHPDPETTKLELTDVGGYQIVIGKGNFKVGDLAVYVQPDSVVPQTEPFKFIWGEHVGIDGTVPERRRRITVKRLRKEFSEGLLLPIGDFAVTAGNTTSIADELTHEGADVSELLGITHWVPAFDKESTAAETAAAPKRRYPKTLKGWFFWTLYKLGFKKAGRSLAQEVAFNYPIYDVDAYKNHKNWVPEGTLVQITEKIHGSNARYTFTEGVFYAGSHEQWKQDGANVWWKAARQFPQIEKWCRENPGLVLYGEVGPTQGDNFRYGAKNGEVFFFAFDVYDPKANTWTFAGDAGFSFNLCVPVYSTGASFGPIVFAWVDGQTTVPGATGIREGVVIRIVGNTTTRGKLKIVSNKFLEKDNK